MSVNAVNSISQTYDVNSGSKAKQHQSEADKAKAGSQDNTVVVYEKSDTKVAGDKVYKRDQATIARLTAEAERRAQSLRELVRKMLLEQGKTYDDATDIYGLLREGKIQVDPETRAQAQKDIAEGGYWSVEQTSERLVSFAKALTGGDRSKADEMIAAVKKGFEQATKAWGGDLPSICKSTIEATVRKLEAWRDNLSDTEAYSDESASEFAGQAAAGALAV